MASRFSGAQANDCIGWTPPLTRLCRARRGWPKSRHLADQVIPSRHRGGRDRMSIAANKQTVERILLEVWSRGDTTAAADLVADNYTIFHDPGDPWEGRTLDRDAYIERVMLSRAPFPDQSFSIHSMLAERHEVAVTWLWTGTHRGDIAGISATNRLIRMSGATVYSFDGAHTTGHWQVSDRLTVFQQLTAR
jgi:steroid delta-isomerase-like uncharacterized protein